MVSRVRLAVTGLDNPVSASFGAGASPESAHVRLWDVATMGSSCRFRHRHAGRRRTSIPRAFGLMTDPACGFSTRSTPARCGLASVRETIRPRELSRIDIEHPSMRREGIPDSAEAIRREPALARRRPGCAPSSVGSSGCSRRGARLWAATEDPGARARCRGADAAGAHECACARRVVVAGPPRSENDPALRLSCGQGDRGGLGVDRYGVGASYVERPKKIV